MFHFVTKKNKYFYFLIFKTPLLVKSHIYKMVIWMALVSA